MIALRTLAIVLCLVLPAQILSAQVPPSVKKLLGEYCLDCHSGDAQQGGLRKLDSVPEALDSLDSEKVWSKVIDKLSSGQMPPANSPQPPPDLRQSANRELHEALKRASLTRQQRDGRGSLRRMNGTEYENTQHTLLHISTPLKELLPEDSTTAGFDNVSSGLDLSATHFLRYQQAAQKAVVACVPVHPPIPFSDKRSGRNMTEKGPNFREGLSRTCRLEDDALIFYTKLPRYGLCATAAVPAAGRYRIEMKAAAVGAEARPIAVGLMKVMQSGREGPVLYDVRDIPHGEPQTIEFECDLAARQAFVVNLLTTWDIRRFKKPIEEYTGPGLKVEWLSIEGPIDTFPSPAYAQLFDDLPLAARSVAEAKLKGSREPNVSNRKIPQHWEADPLVPTSTAPHEDAQRLLARFVPRAFRRPVTDQELARYVAAAHTKLDEGFLFYDAMEYAYQLVLSSPDFLMFLTASSESRLDDYALASRLSYFLWSQPPDQPLLELAAAGQLHQPDQLRAQVERMLAAPAAQQFIKNFTGQWLDLRRIDFTIPDPVLYSDFDQLLLWSMPRESEAFFAEVLKEDMSLLDFVHSDWSMLNERLAQLYGVPNVSGSHLRKVSLPASARRGGVLTQASVLKVTADGTRTSPVLRGAWVLDRLLGQPPAPPPPNIPPIEPDIRGATTIRQQLDLHRDRPACATCHNHIDPPGFALECFDPIGNYREFYRVTARTPKGQVELPYGSGRPVYRGPDVEQGGQTAAGKKFNDISEFKQLLLEDKDQLARNLSQRLLIYATGAEIQYADREVVEQLVTEIRSKNYGLRSLVHAVVQSRPFQMR